MACATLKRTLDFDPLHSPAASPKRRRCTPLLSPSSPTSAMSSSCRQPSAFPPVTPRMSPGQLAANICLEWKRLKRRRHLEESYNDAGAGTSSEPGDSEPQVTDMIHQSSFPSHMAHYHGAPGSPNTSSGGSSLGAGPQGSKDQPMFTLKQVIIICERMLKEQEARIREDYDKVLSCKLAEQYDAFVKFNQDQLHRRFRDTTASYVS
ncbi:akirin-2-like [Acanthaster planci]|uniref:Akirin-2-like n=1 Tax=Acanthaster planci TaxID=133434 RepID=A0A8B7XMI1_ACAPL|nr:akirin-2-like [Acanthaster planci]